jgi:hypothetical protein
VSEFKLKPFVNLFPHLRDFIHSACNSIASSSSLSCSSQGVVKADYSHAAVFISTDAFVDDHHPPLPYPFQLYSIEICYRYEETESIYRFRNLWFLSCLLLAFYFYLFIYLFFINFFETDLILSTHFFQSLFYCWVSYVTCGI